MKKRIVSLLLMAVLTVNALPYTALAENITDATIAEPVGISELNAEKALLSAHLSDIDVASGTAMEDDTTIEGEIDIEGESAIEESVDLITEETVEGTGDFDSIEGTGDSVTHTSSYVEGEVIALADTEEEAENVARLYNGTLKYYSYGVATIELIDKTTKEAIIEAADDSNDLPVVWPNYIEEIEEIDYPEDLAREPYMQKSAGAYYQWFHEYLGTEYAWKMGYMGQGVNVAVLDTGVRYTHHDISGNTLPGKNFYNGAKGTPYEEDPHQHGSHVAGIIGAIYGNDFKGAGVAPMAKVASYRVASPSGSVKQDDIMRGINAVIEDGSFKVINISIGGYSYNGLYAKVCKEAYEHGIAIFASGGNDSISSGHFPSSYEGVVSVGAIDREGNTAYFSNYGSEIDFGFPGASISSLSNTSDTAYRVASGSSMAAPSASGIAAIILSAHPEMIADKSKDSVDSLVQIMKSGAIECKMGNLGAGTTYLPKALLANVTPSEPSIKIVSADGKPASEEMSQKTSINAGEIEVEISTSAFSDAEIYYTLNGKVPNITDDAKMAKSGTMLLETDFNINKISGNLIIKKDGKKKRTLKAIAVNKATGEKSDVKTIVYEFNAYPNEIVIDSVNGTDTVLAGKSIKLVADILPIKSIVKNAKWSSENDNIRVSKAGLVKINKNTAPGKYKISYTCTGFEGTAEFILNVSDKANTTEVKAKERNVKVKVSENNYCIGNVAKCFTINGAEPKAGELRYYSSNKKSISVNKLTGDATVLNPGKAKIYAVANDGSGKKAFINLKAERLVNRIETVSQNTIAAGKSIKINAKVYPENATNKKMMIEYVGKIKDSSILAMGTGGYVNLSKISENDIEAGDAKLFKINGMKIKANADARDIHLFRVVPKDGGEGMESESTFAVNVKSGAITKLSATKEEKNVNLFTSSYIYNRSEVNEKYNKNLQLSPKVEGRFGYDANALNFKSSNSRVVSVDNSGKISVNGVGKAKITCTTVDGSNKKLTYNVKVSIPASSISVKPSDYCYHEGGLASMKTFKAGSEINFVATLGRKYGKPTDSAIVLTSDNKYVKINKKGVAKVSRRCPANTSVTITAKLKSDETLKSTYTVNIGETSSKSGISMVSISNNGVKRKVYMALSDKDKTDKGEFNPISSCKYEAIGDGKPYIYGYEDSISGIKGYVPFVSEVTTTYLYSGEDGWLAKYEAIKDDAEKLSAFYANTGKKMKIIAKRNDGSNEIYYKEFWCFRIKQSSDPNDSTYYNDKTMYVPID